MAASFWLLLAPLLTGAFVGLVVAFLLEEDNPWRWIGLLAGAVAALLLRLRLAAAGARARILSGNSPFGCFRAPRTPEQFADQLCETWMATGRRPAVVGSGWGWFIGRAHARDAVYTHKLKGRIGEFTFLAGTELRSVEVALRKAHGRTFWSTPTMQRISIGSWLARSCHGNSGAAGKPSSYAAARVLVVDLTTLAVRPRGARGGSTTPRSSTSLTRDRGSTRSRRSSSSPSACPRTLGCRSGARTSRPTSTRPRRGCASGSRPRPCCACSSSARRGATWPLA